MEGDEWEDLWSSLKSRGKVRVSSCHALGWLHDVVRTTPHCDLLISVGKLKSSIVQILYIGHSVIINTLAQEKEVNSFRSLFVALRPPISLARRARRREHSNPARRATRRELQVQVEVHTSPTIALAMAASGTNSFVGGAETLVTYSTYYPANASPHGYFKEVLKLSVGLCMRNDAPPAIGRNVHEKRTGQHVVLPQKRMVDFLASYFAGHDETSDTVWDGRHGGME